jgi:hypothetical protein
MSNGIESIDWKGRAATRLSNGVVELTVLTGGGHLAELRFVEPGGPQSENAFWEAPWLTVDPTDERLQELAIEYAPVEQGVTLAGYTGHAICLDYFGAPSAEQAAAGLPLHGEAGVRDWNVTQPEDATEANCRWDVRLPVAELRFKREIRLQHRESVVYVEESVHNERDIDHACHWIQHATFGAPFLTADECSLAASAVRGLTSTDAYENSLLAERREFMWPYAPRDEVDSPAVDLRRLFCAKGRGFLAGMQMDPGRKVQYIVAANWSRRWAMGYCFRRQDFPWMAVWEENCSRENSPWSGRTQARGMEFGTTPLPLDPGEAFPGGTTFDSPTWCVVPAKGTLTARYLIFLVKISAGVNSIENVEVEGDAIRLHGAEGEGSFIVPAHGCEAFLADDQA